MRRLIASHFSGLFRRSERVLTVAIATTFVHQAAGAAISLNPALCDNLSDALDVSALLTPSSKTVEFVVNPAGSTLETSEPLTNFDPNSGGSIQGSLWLRVKTPHYGGVTVSFDSAAGRLGDPLPRPGFYTWFDVYTIPAATFPAYKLPLPLKTVSFASSTGTDGINHITANFSQTNSAGSDILIRMQVQDKDATASGAVRILPDAKAPDVGVESANPASGSQASLFRFTGSAVDGPFASDPSYPVSGIDRVQWRLDGGSPYTAELDLYEESQGVYSVADWSAELAVAPGSHMFEVRAIDRAGNVSPWSGVAFNRSGGGSSEPREATTRDAQSFGVDDAAGTGWIGGTYYVDQASLEYDGAVFGPGRRAYKLDSRGWPINVVYDLATGSVTGLLSLPRR